MRYLFILMSLILVGCKTISSQNSVNKLEWKTLQNNNATLKNWSIKGKLGIKQNSSATQANFFWQQNLESYAIEIFGPFGADRAILQGKPGLVTLRQADGKLMQASSLEALLNQENKKYLPLTYLQYWLRGLYVPLIPIDNINFSKNKEAIYFEQDKWSIKYLSFKLVDKYMLPTKLLVTKHDIKLKIHISSWSTS
ncbi:MAG: rane protein [Francisellaceae bacterium]|nr:rane protein [Francisellaceae bacterium]